MLTIREMSLTSIGENTWRQLVMNSQSATFFQTYGWINLWLQHFEHTLDRSLVFAIYENDVLIGIAPFAVKNNCIEFLTLTAVDTGDTLADFGDIIVLPSKEERVWTIIIEQLMTLKETLGYSIKLNYLNSQSSSFSLLQKMALGGLDQVDVAPKLILPDDWNVYLSELSSHDRHELKRKLKIGWTEGLAMHVSVGEQEGWHAYSRLIKGANSIKQTFYSKNIQSFFSELTFLQGTVLYFLKLDTEIIASLIAFDYKNQVLAYNSAFDVNFRRLSPGVVLFGLVIQHAIEDKKNGFDFLRGDETYKYMLGGVDQPLFCLKNE